MFCAYLYRWIAIYKTQYKLCNEYVWILCTAVQNSIIYHHHQPFLKTVIISKCQQNHSVSNNRKSLIQNCERSELRLHLTVLPDRLIFGRKCQNSKLKCDIWSNFQTLCFLYFIHFCAYLDDVNVQSKQSWQVWKHNWFFINIAVAMMMSLAKRTHTFLEF